MEVVPLPNWLIIRRNLSFFVKIMKDQSDDENMSNQESIKTKPNHRAVDLDLAKESSAVGSDQMQSLSEAESQTSLASSCNSDWSSQSLEFSGELGKLIAKVGQSAKHGNLCPDIVAHVGQNEIAKGIPFKQAVEATKRKLHQIGGAYFAKQAKFPKLLKHLREVYAQGDPALWEETLQQVMAVHASTKERIPMLSEYYGTLFAALPEVNSVIDIASGLNPLAISSMKLAPGASYFAYEIYQNMVDFLNGFFELTDVNGQAAVMDVTQTVPTQQVDLALVLKTLPCLEQIDKTAPVRLLEGLNAKNMIVSYPTLSLCGRGGKGMQQNYGEKFEKIAQDHGWDFQRFEFANELAYLVSK